jgi:ABC-type lipoprotein release transport system permease subunit
MYIPYILKSITRRMSTTTANVLTVAVIIGMLISITVVMNTYTSAVYLPFSSVNSDMMVQKSSGDNTTISDIRVPFGKGIFTDNEIEHISALDHVTGLSKSLVVWNFNKSAFVSLQGVEPESSLGKQLKSWVSDGRFIADGESNTAVVESHFAKFNHLKPGDIIGVGNTAFKIIGTLKIKDGSQLSSSNVFTTLSDAQDLSGIKGYDQLYLKMDDLSSEESIRSGLKSIDSKIIALSSNAISASLGNISKIYQQFYFIGIAIMFLVTLLILFKVNTMSLVDRRKEIGVMQTVGWTKRAISAHIIAELFLQTMAGFALGAFVSFAVITLISSVSITLPSFGLSNKPSTITVPLSFSPEVLIGFFVLMLITSLVISYLLIRKISGMKPSENLYRL